MHLRKSTMKVSNFLHKALGSFKSIWFQDYQKLPNTPLFSPFSRTSCRYPKDSQTDEFYCNPAVEQASEPQIAGKINAMKPIESLVVQEASYESPHKQEKKHKVRCLHKREEHISNVKNKGGCDALAQRMKDLEMMDMGDVDHVLDVKEAIRCYSMIRSPVYLDIVDNFFMDMYCEFSDPLLTSSSIKSSRKKGRVF